METDARTSGWAGIAAAILFLSGFALLGNPPSPQDATAGIEGYLEGQRSEIFASAILLGLGSCLFLWYLTGLRRLLDAPVVPLAALAATVLVLGGISILAGVVVHVPERPLALAGFDVANAYITMGGFGFGFSLVVAGLAAQRTGALDRRYSISAIMIGVLQLATIPGLFVEDGFFAPLGAMARIAFWLLTAWYFAVAIRMVRASEAA
jgi:hypothetical protein